MRVIDLTHTIREGMPVYPGTEPPRLPIANDYEPDFFRETKITMYSHTGTHVDPPAHIVPGAMTLDEFPPEQFSGMALVIDCRDLKEGDAITMERLRRYGGLTEQADFLLFNLGWDNFWGTEAYFGNFPCVDEDVLDHIIAGNYKGIGFDVISLDPVDSIARHRKLFRAKAILNIENLKNLDKCGPGLFRFGCFPLKIEKCDGSPVRAMAWLDE